MDGFWRSKTCRWVGISGSKPADYPGLQRPIEKRENGTSGSVRHPVVLYIQSEANIPILGYSMIDQILKGDPHFYNTMFWLHFK